MHLLPDEGKTGPQLDEKLMDMCQQALFQIPFSRLVPESQKSKLYGSRKILLARSDCARRASESRTLNSKTIL
jgi:hypothetical protein